jgi:hypothetical protein
MDVTIVVLGDGPLGADALAVLARARVVAGAAGDLAQIRHLLPPVTATVPLDHPDPQVLVVPAAGLAQARSQRPRAVVIAP